MQVRVENFKELKEEIKKRVNSLLRSKANDLLTLVQTNELAGHEEFDNVFVKSLTMAILDDWRFSSGELKSKYDEFESDKDSLRTDSQDLSGYVVVTIQPSGIASEEQYVLTSLDIIQPGFFNGGVQPLPIGDLEIGSDNRVEKLFLEIKGEAASTLQANGYYPYTVKVSFVEDGNVVDLDLFDGRKLMLLRERELIRVTGILREIFSYNSSTYTASYKSKTNNKIQKGVSESVIEVVNRVKHALGSELSDVVLLFQPIAPNDCNYVSLASTLKLEEKGEFLRAPLRFSTVVLGNFSEEILNNGSLYKIVLPHSSLDETKEIIEKLSCSVEEERKLLLERMNPRLLQGMQRTKLLKLGEPGVSPKACEGLNFTRGYEDFVQIIEPYRPDEQTVLYEEFTQWVQKGLGGKTNFYLLVGPPGTGKTTMGKTVPYLLDKANSNPFPLVELKTFGKPFWSTDKSKYESFFEMLLMLKECVLFIDEIDKKIQQHNFVLDLYTLLDKKQRDLVVVATANTVEHFENDFNLQGILSRANLLVVDYPNKEMIRKFVKHFVFNRLSPTDGIVYPKLEKVADVLYLIFQKDDNWSFRQIENIIREFVANYEGKYLAAKSIIGERINLDERYLNWLLNICLEEAQNYKPENIVGKWLLDVREKKSYRIVPSERKTLEEPRLVIESAKDKSPYTLFCEEFIKQRYKDFYEKVYKNSGEDVRKLLRLALSFDKDGEVGIESILDALYFNFRTRPFAIKLYLEYGQKFPELFSGVVFRKVIEKIEKEVEGNFFDEFKQLTLTKKVDILLKALSYEHEVKLKMDEGIKLSDDLSSRLAEFTSILSASSKVSGYNDCISLICSILQLKGDDGYIKLQSRSSSFEVSIEGISRNLTESGSKLLNYIPVGRSEEIKRVIELLVKGYQAQEQNSNSIILVGQSGAGKTTLVQGVGTFLAWFYDDLGMKKTVIVEANSNSLVAGTIWRGSFEERLEKLLKSILDRKDSHTVLFIDEMHTVMGLGSASGQVLDANNSLKPFLSNTERKITLIGCTTDYEYSVIQADEAFSRRLNKVEVPIISRHRLIRRGEIQDYLNRFVSDYEVNFEKVESIISILETVRAFATKPDPLDVEEIIKQATKTACYSSNETNKDNRISQDNETSKDNKISKDNETSKTTIGLEDIKRAVVLRAGLKDIIDFDKGLSVSKDRLNELREQLQSAIVGQDECIEKIVDQLKSLTAQDGLLTRFVSSGIDAELVRPRPMAKMFFIGSTGCGKTQTAQIIASAFFNNRILEINCSDFNTISSIDERISRFLSTNSSGVILLDEVDKASDALKKFLYPILDGQISIRSKTYYLNNFVIIATGNYQFDETKYFDNNRIGFVNLSSYERDALEKVNDLLNERNSWKARFDLALVFNPIYQKEHLKEIMKRKILGYTKNYLKSKTIDADGGSLFIRVEVNDEVVSQINSSNLVKEGARIVTNFLETKIYGLVNDSISPLIEELHPNKSKPKALVLQVNYKDNSLSVTAKVLPKSQELILGSQDKSLSISGQTEKKETRIEESKETSERLRPDKKELTQVNKQEKTNKGKLLIL